MTNRVSVLRLLPIMLVMHVTALMVPESFAPPSPSVEESPVLVGAGDISTCSNDNDEATARLLDETEGTVFTLGDNVYDHGSAEEFADCYDPTWGRHLERTRPIPGNHDYDTPGAAGYFDYFGDNAGEPGKGYYSYDLGEWHIVALNTNCFEIGGCEEGSAQLAWLRADLAEHPTTCTVVLTHHPRFSSGEHGGDVDLIAIWETLHAAGVEVVLSGHDHIYERFAPQDPSGGLDERRGIRQFVVGTGGAGLYDVEDVRPNSETRDDETFGMLTLTLHPESYDWEFLAADDDGFSDSGTARCH